MTVLKIRKISKISKSFRNRRRELNGLIRLSKEIETIRKGLIVHTITWILIVIRTSRLSNIIKNAAQGKRSSEIGMSLLVTRTLTIMETSIMSGVLPKTLTLGSNRNALVMVLL